MADFVNLQSWKMTFTAVPFGLTFLESALVAPPSDVAKSPLSVEECHKIFESRDMLRLRYGSYEKIKKQHCLKL